MWWIILGIYVVCGVLAYGVTYAYFQRDWPELAEEGYQRDRIFPVFVGLLGFFGLFLAIIKSDWIKHGLKFK